MPETAGGTTPADAASFEADPPGVYVAKVKALLTGGVANANEVADVAADGNALKPLVHGWVQSPAFRQILQDFFADAFQQSLVTSGDLHDNLYDQSFTPNDALTLNLQQSFARTALYLADTKQPFTATVTTQTYMMTTAMMAYYAFSDTSVLTDEARLNNRWFAADPNFTMFFHGKGAAINLSDAANPASANYMHFNVPNLANLYIPNNSAAGEANDMRRCAAEDPVPINTKREFIRANHAAQLIYGLMNGGGLLYWIPEEYKVDSYLCKTKNTGVPWLSAADYNDWRPVTVRKPMSGETLSTFFDLPNLRKTDALLLQSPRVGFFTTPAFLAQYPTNLSNTARVTVNQTLIVALGGQVDGSDTLVAGNPNAIDPVHAAQPACFACHQTLDPMRQFFRQDYTVTYSLQANQKVSAIPAEFSFRGTKGAGSGVAELGRIVAQHPLFASAWVAKVCSWATSAPCAQDDPEVQRIATDFAANGHDFYAMVEEVFASPLVTYAAPTASTLANGKTASMARSHQFCAILNARLGLSDVCDRQNQQDDGRNTVPSRTAAISPDLYSRGETAPAYVTTPDPLYVNNVENVCGLLAVQLIDATQASWAISSDVDRALERMVGELMGLYGDDAAEVKEILRQHNAQAIAKGASPTVALRSSFVLACRSPMVTSLGGT